MLSDLRCRLRSLFKRTAIDGELDVELRFHVEQQIESYKKAGLDEVEAARRARLEFGGLDQTKEAYRDASGIRLLDEIWRDVRLAIRSLLKAPLVSAAAVLSLTLAIGANSALFTALRAASIRSLPLPDPERLVTITTYPPGQPQQRDPARLVEYFAWRDQAKTFTAIGTMLGWSSTLGATHDGEPAERINGWRFSASTFRALGVQPQLGRLVTPDEDIVGAPEDIVVISDSLWRTHFGADRDVIGRSILLDDQKTTIVGVMPPGFGVFDTRSDFWIPSPFSRFQVQSRSATRVLSVIGRLKPDSTLARSQADIAAISARLAEEDPGPQKGRAVTLEPLDQTLFGGLRRTLGLLQAAVASVLLIACANVAGLLLTRSLARQRDVAIRTALGASRGRIIQMFLAESLLLSLCGGVLGLALAWAGVRALTLAPPTWLGSMPGSISALRIDAGVLGFTLLVSVVTGLGFGLAPALGAWSRDLITPVKYVMGSAGPGRRGALQSALVITQIALTLVLLVGAGLLIKSFWRLERVNLGMDPRQVLSFQTRLPAGRGFRMVGIKNGFTMLEVSPVPADEFERVRGRLLQVAGVESVAGTNVGLVGGGTMPASIEFVGSNPRGDAAAQPVVNYALVTPAYFSTLRIPVRKGREFTDRDTRNAPLVAIINETMARRFWPGQDPIGQQIVVSIVPDQAPRQIVGVVADTPTSRWDRSPSPAVYVPHQQESLQSRTPYGQSRINIMYVLRLNQPVASVLPAVRRAVADVDSSLPVSQIEMVNEYLARQVEAPRDSMLVVALFGGVALLLAVLGIYALIAYGVVQRTREIAIRMALGARRSLVLGLMMRRSVTLMAAGLMLGLAGAAAVTRYLSALLFDVTPLDATTFVAASILFIVIAAAASYVPARRATKIDPLAVLRYD
jgi:putative ABC transport system permease protein